MDTLKKMAVCLCVFASLGGSDVMVLGDDGISVRRDRKIVVGRYADYGELFINWALPRIELDLMEYGETLETSIGFVKTYLGEYLWRYVEEFIDWENVKAGFSLLNDVEEV